MHYDFERVYNRRKEGASKWLAVNEWLEDPEEDIIPMTVADMDFATPPMIKEALKKYIDSHVLGYTMPTVQYLQAVQDFYRKHHHVNIEHNWITTTAGVVPALATAVRAFTNPNDAIIVMPPIYPPFYEVIETQGRKIARCPLILKDDHYEIDFERFEALAANNETKMFMMCSPHNPGGRVWTRDELQRIAEIVIKYQLFLVSDEIHCDLVHEGHTHHVAFSIDERLKDRSIVCSAASKTFNIAGLQCSNIIIPNVQNLDIFLAEHARTGAQGANVLGLIATQTAYQEGLPWQKASQKVLAQNLQLVYEFFRQWDERWLVMEQESSFLAWIGFEKITHDAETFLSKMMKDAHFYVNWGSDYGEEGKYFIRINVGLPTAALQKNLEHLKENFSLDEF
ncbi:MalY/PatB family protein [Allofustis seminis]|uniref:MalY/PatB family protein n=1 Tax=Allofustis seminis TaxID=166939 RepID=UPI00037CA094|nr:MalY/PatB family protein [Allofustis seminis]